MSSKTKNIERERFQLEIDKCNAKIFRIEKELNSLKEDQVRNIFDRLEKVELFRNRIEHLEMFIPERVNYENKD